MRLAADALEQHEAAHASADEGPSEEPLSPALSHLLPPLLYKGDSSTLRGKVLTFNCACSLPTQNFACFMQSSTSWRVLCTAVRAFVCFVSCHVLS